MTARILCTLALLSSTAAAQTYPTPTFQGLTLQADPAAPNQAVRRGYLDQRLGSALPSVPPCSLLGGTGSAGSVQGLTLGAGLACSAGGVGVSVGTAAGTVAAGNDGRITGAVQGAGGNASSTVVTASGGSVARSLAAVAADTLKVLNFGAVCDGVTDDTGAVQAAFAAAAAVPNGAVLEVPQRACLISGPVSQSLGAKRSIHLKGAGGLSGFVSSNGSGFSITLTDGTAGFDASDVAFMRVGSGQAGTGLSVQATVTQTHTISHFRNVLFSGTGAFWQVGLRLSALSAPVIEGMRSYQPDGSGSGSGYGLHLTGPDTAHFLTDAKISNSLFQGGYATIKVDGAVQGVYVANSEGIGSDYGIHASDATGVFLQELLTVTNSHWNNALAGIYMLNFHENQISNNLFLHFAPLPARSYQAIFADRSGYMTITGNTFLGAGAGAETFFKASGAQLYTVTGNNVVTLNGLCIDTAGAANAVITGNSCQGVTDPGIAPGATSMVSSNLVNGRNELVGPGSGTALVRGSQANTSGFLSLSVNGNLSASGSGQSDAAVVSANQVFIGSAAAGTGVRLPATASLASGSATTIELWNNGANPVLIYPAAGDTILGGAANAPTSLAAGGQQRCWWPGSGTRWACYGTLNAAQLAPLASPALTGTPTAPTAAPGTSTSQLATTAFVASAVPAVIAPAFQVMNASGTFVPASGASWVRFRLFGPGGNGGTGATCTSGSSCSGGAGGGAGAMAELWVPVSMVQSGGCAVFIGVAGASNTNVSCNSGLGKTAFRGGNGAAGQVGAAAGSGGGGTEVSAGGNGSGASNGGNSTYPSTGSGVPNLPSSGGVGSAAGACSRGSDNAFGATGGASGTGLSNGTAQGNLSNCFGGTNGMNTTFATPSDTGCEPNVGGRTGLASTSAASGAGGSGGVPAGGGGGGGSGTVAGGSGGAGGAGRVCIWQG